MLETAFFIYFGIYLLIGLVLFLLRIAPALVHILFFPVIFTYYAFGALFRNILFTIPAILISLPVIFDSTVIWSDKLLIAFLFLLAAGAAAKLKELIKATNARPPGDEYLPE